MSNWIDMEQWYTVLPPSRPTKNELNRIKDHLTNVDRNSYIGILGSTPEFRELLHRLGFKHRVIFDKSVDFYLRMSKLSPDDVLDGEMLIVGDWVQTLKEWSQRFSVILSDLTMGNVPYCCRSAFYRDIAGALDNDGVFIDKVLAFDFDIPTIEDLFEKYEQLPINLRTINDFSSEVLFCSDLVKKKNIVDSTVFYDIIKQGDFSQKIKFFAEAAHMITPEGFIWYYGKSWDELKKDYEECFSSQTIYIEDDETSPYYKRTKQIFSVK